MPRQRREPRTLLEWNLLLATSAHGNVVYVSRQLGHANASITLEVYAHLFDRADHAEMARDALEASYAAMASSRAC